MDRNSGLAATPRNLPPNARTLLDAGANVGAVTEQSDADTQISDPRDVSSIPARQSSQRSSSAPPSDMSNTTRYTVVTPPGLGAARHPHGSQVPAEHERGSRSLPSDDESEPVLVKGPDLQALDAAQEQDQAFKLQLQNQLSDLTPQSELSHQEQNQLKDTWQAKVQEAVQHAVAQKQEELRKLFAQEFAEKDAQWQQKESAYSDHINRLTSEVKTLRYQARKSSATEAATESAWREKVLNLEEQVDLLKVERDSAKELADKAFLSKNEYFNSHVSTTQSAEPIQDERGIFYPLQYFDEHPEEEIPQHAQKGMFVPQQGFIPTGIFSAPHTGEDELTESSTPVSILFLVQSSCRSLLEDRAG